jgi:hypothetical protein
MRFVLAFAYMFASASSALAQYGVSNVRDNYGNLIRNTGMNPAQNPQSRVHNEPIKGGSTSAPSVKSGANNRRGR